MNTLRTDFLLSDFGLLYGFASVLDLGGTLVTFNESPSGEYADTLAIKTDWDLVGQDIKSAYNEFFEAMNKNDR